MKYLYQSLFCILLILISSCTPTDANNQNSSQSSSITIVIQPEAALNVAKYKVGLLKADGTDAVTPREAVSLTYVFTVTSGNYTAYARAVDASGNSLAYKEKDVFIPNEEKIFLTLTSELPVVYFTVSQLPACITKVAVKANNGEETEISYTSGNSLMYNQLTQSGTYNFSFRFLDANSVCYFTAAKTVSISSGKNQLQITPVQTKVTPLSFNFNSGESIAETDKVIITSPGTSNVAIHYTLDQTTPTIASTLYIDFFSLADFSGKSVTIKATGFAEGLEDSGIQTVTYKIDAQRIHAPEISPAGGKYTSAQTITLTCESENAIIYYSLDGNDSKQYSAPFTISKSSTLKAFASLNGETSTTVSVDFIIEEEKSKVATPEITENNSQITLSCSTSGATLYYTTDESEPTSSSTKYTTPFTINYSKIDVPIKVIAIHDGYINSDIAEKVFQFSGTVEKPSVAITPSSGSIASSKTFSINVTSAAVLTSAEVLINGSNYTISRGNQEFRVSDFAIQEGDTITIRVSAANRCGETSSVTQLTVADPKLTGQFNELRMYQVMVSSFQSGDSSLGFYTGYGPSKHDGDLQGIINALDYIKGLGMNALWLTPVFNTNASDQLSSTGYYAYDYFSIDPHFGTINTFKNLVDECHKRNMYVILDGVFGHWSAKGCKASPTGKIPERSHGQYDGCDYPGTNNCTLDFFKEVATYWIKNYKIDGWRLDQCYQTGLGNKSSGDGCYTNGHNYWYEIRTAVEEAAAANGTPGTDWGSLGYMVGEHWNGNDSNPPDIQKYSVEKGSASGYGLRSCFDFPSRYKMVQMFAEEESKEIKNTSISNMDYVLKSASAKGYYHDVNNTQANGYVPNLFLTNHDLTRFGDLVSWRYNETPSSDNYWKRHKVAISALAAYTGPITIYYGDEYGDQTGTTVSSDNMARSDGRISGFNSNEQALHDYTAKLMTIRNENEALWNGSYQKLSSNDTFFAAEKSANGKRIVYLLNYSYSAVSYTVGTTGIDLMTGTATASNVSVPALSAMFIQRD